MTHIDFDILTSHLRVIYLRFIKSTFLSGTTEKFKVAAFFSIYSCISM